MELENTTELLCIQGRERKYAFEFPYITEICPGVCKSRKFPVFQNVLQEYAIIKG